MDEHYREGPDVTVAVRIARYLVPWAALAIVVLIAVILVGQYRSTRADSDDSTPTVSQDTTGSVETTEPVGSTDVPEVEPGVETTASGKTVVVLIEGLNLRTESNTDSGVIKKLALDSRLTLLEEMTGWYKVRDDAGDEGWVAAGGKYTRVE